MSRADSEIGIIFCIIFLSNIWHIRIREDLELLYKIPSMRFILILGSKPNKNMKSYDSCLQGHAKLRMVSLMLDMTSTETDLLRKRIQRAVGHTASPPTLGGQSTLTG